MAGGGGGGGEEVKPEDQALARHAPPVLPGARPKGLQPRPVGMRPAQLHGDRPVFLECRADAVVLLAGRREFPVSSLTGDPAGNALVQAVRQALERLRAAQRPEGPPFRPQIVFLVRPDGVRTYHLVYPLLAALPAAQRRRNLHADDDVYSVLEGP